MPDGLFITFEGIEGSGKTTQLKILEDHLKLEKREVLATREPGGTKIGNQIRRLLLDPAHAPLDPTAELLLYIAARAQHVFQLITPALQSGKLVLCDRFFDATVAYQGGGRGLSMEWMSELNRQATGGLEPRLTFLLDCPVELGLSRARERYQGKAGAAKGDRIEQEEVQFHERVRDRYLEIARKEPNRVIVLNATESINDLHEHILSEMKRIL